MVRQIFTLPSAVSLLVCLSTVVLWVRSYWVVESFERHTPNPTTHMGSTVILASGHGSLLLAYFPTIGDSKLVNHGSGWVPVPERVGWQVTRFKTARGLPQFIDPGGSDWKIGPIRYQTGGTLKVLSARYWIVVAILLVLPSVPVIAALRRRRRLPQGCCVQCAYDSQGIRAVSVPSAVRP